MNFKGFNLTIGFRVILITINCFVFIWAFYQNHLNVAKFTFGALIIIQTILLITFINKRNYRFFQFMELIKNQGMMERFDEMEGPKSQKKLATAYNEIIKLIANFKFEKEGEHLYFLQTLEIIGTSILSIDENGNIDIINKSARELLNIEKTKTLNQLKTKHPEFITKLLSLKNDDQIIYRFQTLNQIKILNIHCITFRNSDKFIRIFSFHDISTELENEELDAWQKLIRVLRHEIMNSITPINSLTNTTIRLLSKTNTTPSPEIIKNALEALHAIEKRNKGLLSFVESYRTLTNIPKPHFQKIELGSLVEEIKILFNEAFSGKGISFQFSINPQSLSIKADEKLITQVLINLIKNAIEASENTKSPMIDFTAFISDKNETKIMISDNGKGISESDVENIFIPFYTTKEKGSGIGLSLSRQIMRLHKGSISVSTVPGKGSTFTLTF